MKDRRRSRAKTRVAQSFEGSRIHLALLVLIAIKLAGTILVLDPFADSPFELAKSLFSRSAEWLIAGAIAAAIGLYGFVIIPRSRLLLALGVLLAATGLATATAAVPDLALYGDLNRYQGLTFTVDMCVLALACAIALRRPRDYALIGAALAATCLAAAGYALIQQLGLDPWKWVDDPRGQPFASLGNSGYYAGFLVVSVAAAMTALFYLRRDDRRVVIVLASVAVASLVLVLSLAARSSLLAAAGAFAVWAALALRRRGLAQLRRPALIVSVVLLLGAALAAPTPLGERVIRSFTGGDASLSQRATIYRLAVVATAQRPLLGWGPDSVSAYDQALRTVEDERALEGIKNNSAHSWLLQASATTGLLGVAALLALVAATLWALWRALARHEAIAAVLMTAYAVYWVGGLTGVSTVSTAWIPFVVTGAAAGLGTSATLVAVTPLLWRRIGAAVLGLAAVAGATTPNSALQASRTMHELRGTLGGPRHPATLPLAQRVVALDSGRATYWDAAGFGFFLNERIREATNAYEESARRAPYDPEILISLARAYARRSATGETSFRSRALETAARATTAAPSSPRAHASRAEVALDVGEGDLAMREAVRAVEISMKDATFDKLVAQCALSVADPAAARLAVERLVIVRDSAALEVALAQLSTALRDWGAVRRYATRALELDATNVDARRLLAAIPS